MRQKERGDFKLYFAGIASLIQVKNSINIGNVEGLPLYLSPGGHDKLSSQCFMPAWSVPMSSGDDTDPITVDVKVHEVEITFPSGVMKRYEGREESLTTVISVPYLAVVQEQKGQDLMVK